MKLTRQQIFAIAGEAQVDPRTVAKIYEGKPSKMKLVRERVMAAAKRLKMPVMK